MINIALSIGQLVVALLLVVLNGFFVTSEFAFVRIRGTSVEQLAAEGRTGAATLSKLRAMSLRSRPSSELAS